MKKIKEERQVQWRCTADHSEATLADRECVVAYAERPKTETEAAPGV